MVRKVYLSLEIAYKPDQRKFHRKSNLIEIAAKFIRLKFENFFRLIKAKGLIGLFAVSPFFRTFGIRRDTFPSVRDIQEIVRILSEVSAEESRHALYHVVAVGQYISPQIY